MTSNRIAIIGSGPAGIATAIQLKRFGLEPDLFEMNRIGGLLWNANKVENYPGFPNGISGPDLVGLMEKHLEKFEVSVINSEITNISSNIGKYIVSVNGRSEIYDYVIMATGTKPIVVKNVHGMVDSKHIHHDIGKILNSVKKDIAIVGSGDAAFDQALNLGRLNNVILVNRSKHVKCLPLLADKAFKNPAIHYFKETRIIRIVAPETDNKSGGKLIVHIKRENEETSMRCDELVFAIGRKPNLDIIDRLIDRKNLFFAGDVHNGLFRQTSIAVGEGVKVAMKIYQLINEGIQ